VNECVRDRATGRPHGYDRASFVCDVTRPVTMASQNGVQGGYSVNIVLPFHMFSNGTSKKDKVSRYRPGVAHRVGRGIALLFHDRGTRRG